VADLQLEAQLPAPAAEALAYLYKKLGRGRVDGPSRLEGEHELVLTRASGKTVTFYGRTPAEVLAKARAFVEQLQPRTIP
jgi:hypothetical protein